MAVSAIAGIASAIGGAIAANVGALTFSAVMGTLFTKVGAAYFLLGAGLSMVSRALAPQPDLGAQMRGITQTTREPAGTRKIIYGKIRVGGNVVFISHSGTDNKYLHLAIVFATHEIQAYDEIWFNDNKIWTASGGFQGDWGTYVTIDRKFGTSGQSASTQLVNANSRWTTNHKLSGIAYIAFKLEWDQDKFPQGVPNITAVVRGKKVYDPRNQVTAYSQNPALCLRDYMMSEYGLDEIAANIDNTSVGDAADLCDEQVSLAGGGTQDRYQCNGVIDTANQIKANIEQLLSPMGGKLVYSGGKYFIDGAEYKTPTLTFTEADCIGDIQTQTKQSRRGIYNGVKGIFVSEEKNYKVLDYPAQISSSYATEDGDPLYLDMPLPFVTNNLQAQRLAKIALLRSRQQTVMTMTVNLKGLQVKVGDTIQVTNDRLNYSNKVFEVVDYSLAINDGDTLGVNLVCIETASAIYDWTTSDEEDFLSGGELPLYDGRTVDNVTSLQHSVVGLKGPDGKLITSVDLTWTAPDDAFVEFYVVTYEKDSDGDVYEVQTRNPRVRLSELTIGSAYTFTVKAQNLIGVRSSGTTLNVASLAGDTTAPAVPTSPTTTGGIRQITVEWTEATDEDLALTLIYYNDTDNLSTATRSKTRGEEFVYTLADDETSPKTKYFWLSSIDYSGNESAKTSSFTGTSVRTKENDIADGEVTTGKIENGAVTEVKIEDGAVTANKITVTNLEAINADLGDITGGTLQAGGVTDPIPSDIFTRSTSQNIPTGNENGAFIDLDGGSFVFGDADSFISFAENAGATAFELDIKGVLAPTKLDFAGVTDTTVMPSTIKASGYTDASIGKAALSDEAYDEIARRVGNTGGFYTTATGFYLGSTKNIELASAPDHGTDDVRVRVAINDTFTAPANFVANSNGVKITVKLFAKKTTDSAYLSTHQIGTTQTFVASPTLLQYATRYTIDESYEVTLVSGTDIEDNTDYDFKVELTRLANPNAFKDYNDGGANDSTGTPVTLEVSEGTTVVAGTGNANTLDSLDSTQFLRSDTNDTFDGDLTITGQLILQGSIDQYNVTDLDVTDKTITVNSGNTQSLSDGAGLIVDRGTAADASITWDETNDKFTVTNEFYAPTIAGDELVLGQWAGNGDYGALLHKNHTGTEYMIISRDDHTYISATTGYDVKIRGGNNVSTYEIIVYPDQDATASGNKIWHAGDFTSTNVTNWNTAYGWGDHSTQGYLTAEADTLATVTGRGATTTNAISTGAITTSGTLKFSGNNHYFEAGTNAVDLKNASNVVLGGFNASGVNTPYGYQISGTTVINSSRNLVNIGTISSGDITTTGTVLINDSLGGNSTSAMGNFDRLEFSNSFSDVMRGPNKILMYNSSGWVGGFGIANDLVTYSSGGSHVFYSSQNTTTYDERFRIDDSGDITVNRMIIARSNSGVSAPSNADHTLGTRIKFFDGGSADWYAQGIESSNMWFNTAGGFKWYNDSNIQMTLSADRLGIATTPHATDKLRVGGSISQSAGSIFAFGDLVIGQGALKQGTTTLIDSSRNLTNIGTISSGAINASSTIKAETAFGGFITLKRADTTTTNNTDIGVINFEHTDTDDAGVAATILVSGDGDAGGAKMRFYTGTPTSRAERLAIDKDGTVNIVTSGLDFAGTTVIASTRRIYASNGTVAKAAFSFDGESNTGMYKYGTNQIGFTAGGSLIAYIQSGATYGLVVQSKISATGGNSDNWNTAYGWGDHSAAGYATNALQTNDNITVGTISSGAITSSGAVTGTSFTTTGTRVVNVANGILTIKGDTGGWAFGLHALGSSNTNHGGFGFLGGADSLSYYYIGAIYNHATSFRFYKNGQLNIGATTILDSNRVLQNVTLGHSNTGARFETNGWMYDTDVKARFYFEGGGRTFFGSDNGYVYRDNSDTGRATISNYGGINLLSGGDGQVGSTVALAVGGTTTIDSSRRVFGTNGSFTGYAAIGSRIGTINPSLSVSGATNSVPFLAKSGSYSTVFSVLPWSNAITYLASGTYYQGGSWVHASPNDYECLLGISGNTGGRWYATTNGVGGSWNHASDVQLWNNSGVWTSSVNTGSTITSAGAITAGNASTSLGYYVGTTQVIQGSTRNLVNIGTITAGLTKLTPSGWNAPPAHAALNIGYSGSGETRAIDIDGNWSVGESKSITFTHGTLASHIVGQINVAHKPTANTGGSSIRWGKLYHGGDSSQYTMELHSESTSYAYLDINRTMVNIGQDSTYGAGYGVIGFGGRTNGYNRIFGRTGTQDGLFLAAATGRKVFVRSNGNGSNDLTLGQDDSYTSYSAIGFGSQVQNGYNRVFGHKGTGDGLYLTAATGRGMFFRVNGSGSNSFQIHSDGSLAVGASAGTVVLDQSRNLTNIGTIGSSFLNTTSSGVVSISTDGSSYKSGMLRGALEIGSTSRSYRYTSGWSGSMQSGILANTSEDWEFMVHDAGDALGSIFVYESANNAAGLIRFGRAVGYGTADAVFDGNVGVGVAANSSYPLYVGGHIAQSSGSIYSFGDFVMGNGGLKKGSTTIIDSSRNLRNVTAHVSEAEYGQSMVGNFGQWLAHSYYASSGFNTAVQYWGWNFVQGNTNAPHTASGQWYRNRVSLGNAYGHGVSSGDYWLEMAYPRTTNTTGQMYIRACESGTIGSWYEVGAAIRGNSTVNGRVGIGTSPESGFGRLHIKESDSGATPYQTANGGITVERNGRTAINLLSPNTSSGYLFFADPQSAVAGYIGYDHSITTLELKSEGYIKTYGSGLDVTAGNIRIAGTEVISGARNGIFERLRADGGNLIMGDEAFSADANYVGMKTSLMSGSNDYMILSGISDGNTYVSAKDGSAVHIRGGGNNSGNDIVVGDTTFISVDTANLNCSGNVTAYHSSDKSLKENIRIIDNPIEKIKQIRGVYFDWTDDYIKEQSGDGQIDVRKDDVGVIAQDVQPVLDEVVTTRDDGTLAVRYEKMIALCIEAIKEQQDQIDSLKDIIKEMTDGNN